MSTQPIPDILSKLPVYNGIVWNGATFEVTMPITLHAPLPTSRNPRVASENFAAPYLYAIVSIAGRDVGPLSRNRAEEEVALLPGSVLSPATGIHPVGKHQVQVLIETIPDRPLPTLPEDDALAAILASADAAAPFTVTSPGRFYPR
ncbi:hypothetical protein [Microbacterium luticocti]|uniref:hypothetical protein n=1 Tax=Microbacterium luticocti TaxID=451764 RepID=UPI00040F69EB|nr:hypothetical protein [Microbacterium luticocti]